MPNASFHGDNLQVLRDLPPRLPSYQPATRVRPAEGEQGELGELAG